MATPPNFLTCGKGFSAPVAASNFMVTTSYDAAANIYNSSNPVWPTADGVTWWSVKSIAVPPTNDICGEDLSALTLTSPINGVCPLIPNVDTQPSDGETYEAVGFGITSPRGQTAGTRYDVTGMTVQCFGSSDCGDTTISATKEWIGGSPTSKGTCEGDSGGPALDSLGRVIGSVSRGPAGACNSTIYESYSGQAAWIKKVAADAASDGGYTAAGWVTGGATSDSANGYCPTADAGAADAGAADAGTDAGDASDGADADAAAAHDASSGAVEDSGPVEEDASIGATADAATSDNAVIGDTSGDGCGCVTAGASPEGARNASFALALLALVLPMRRRMRRARAAVAPPEGSSAW
ncbi:hypothetical protein AKJ09_02407 [Labilithrix luteola]|uniref:Peptidase S1 domain-containing protein n=1 Tax=Labilithrix luteola TaxID=1391654 RepID=A0A0K1PQE5_9BACT|nr:hypothetical protein AKJ09_02407 [Labilithrix luteola]